MKKILFAFLAFAALFSMAACDDQETYADQRNRERDSINAFLRNENIKVITEQQFKERIEARKTNPNLPLTSTTPDNNEYVLFESNGVYMQVIEPGCGDYIQQGETTDVLVRFYEYNLNTLARIDSVNYTNLTLTNNISYYSPHVDKMAVTNTSGTFTGVFDVSTSLFAQTYNSSSYSTSVSGTVPSGWLVPFSWVKIGRGNGEGEKIAHVRLLVPHTYGSNAAATNVYACLYDMTLQRGR